MYLSFYPSICLSIHLRQLFLSVSHSWSSDHIHHISTYLPFYNHIYKPLLSHTTPSKLPLNVTINSFPFQSTIQPHTTHNLKISPQVVCNAVGGQHSELAKPSAQPMVAWKCLIIASLNESAWAVSCLWKHRGEAWPLAFPAVILSTAICLVHWHCPSYFLCEQRRTKWTVMDRTTPGNDQTAHWSPTTGSKQFRKTWPARQNQAFPEQPLAETRSVAYSCS